MPYFGYKYTPVRDLFDEKIRLIAQYEIPRIVRDISITHGLPVPYRVGIDPNERSLADASGVDHNRSLFTNRVRIRPRFIRSDPSYLEHLSKHELVHLIQGLGNHRKPFWREVIKHSPDAYLYEKTFNDLKTLQSSQPYPENIDEFLRDISYRKFSDEELANKRKEFYKSMREPYFKGKRVNPIKFIMHDYYFPNNYISPSGADQVGVTLSRKSYVPSGVALDRSSKEYLDEIFNRFGETPMTMYLEDKDIDERLRFFRERGYMKEVSRFYDNPERYKRKMPRINMIPPSKVRYKLFTPIAGSIAFLAGAAANAENATARRAGRKLLELNEKYNPEEVWWNYWDRWSRSPVGEGVTDTLANVLHSRPLRRQTAAVNRLLDAAGKATEWTVNKGSRAIDWMFPSKDNTIQ